MRTRAHSILFSTLLLGLVFAYGAPEKAEALGLYVPVVDGAAGATLASIQQNTASQKAAFDAYATKFEKLIHDDEQGSLRALLSLNPAPGETAELFLPGKNPFSAGGKMIDPADPDNEDPTLKGCSLRPITSSNTATGLDENSAWNVLYTKGVIDESAGDYSTVQVNNSTSLSCLLQELVEQNKLALNLQIHSMLRDYIESAQATSLAQRTSGIIAKANLEIAQQGLSRTIKDSEGNVISEENFSLIGGQPTQYANSLAESRTRTLQQRILGKSDAPDSLQICAPAKYDAARALLQAGHQEAVDPLDALGEQVSCTLTDPTDPENGLFAKESDYNTYLKDMNSGQQDGLKIWQDLMLNDQNTGPGARLALQNAQSRQLAEIKEQTKTDYIAGGGILPDRKCDPDDPNCDIRYSKIVTASKVIGDRISEYAGQQDKQFIEAKSEGDLTAADKNGAQSTSIFDKGLSEVNTQDFVPDQDINKLIGDFFNSIQNGYFDIQSGTVDWATGAMLKIYDRTMLNQEMIDGNGTFIEDDSTATTTPTTP
ncbi:MAG TPA: hypothetical protein VJ579_01855 [Candidatus Paceibacterota bacterium]|nr:hypothetical protein [Candidatus Paceibacterota bacterium]